MKSSILFIKATRAILVAIAFGFTCHAQSPSFDDPLPSWNDGKTKQSIISFIEKTTKAGSQDFIPVGNRIACFDNDGTLWAEQPMYFQFMFAIDQIKAMAPQHPEWKNKESYKSILAGDIKKALSSGEKGIIELMMVTHTGMTTETFDKTVRAWSDTARHPRFKKLYTQCIYQPMLELLNFLRANGYKTFIVSGGGKAFIRPWSERVYGIPTEQVIGSSVKLKYEDQNGNPVLMRLPEVFFIDDKEDKPVGIENQIGKRPVLSFGNSDGDFQMLRWTTTGSGPRLGLLVHHDDAAREWAYDRKSPVGQLSKGLDEASANGWIVVSMKNDWKKIFPD